VDYGNLKSRFRNLRWRTADRLGLGVYGGFPDRHRCVFIHIPKTAGSSVVYSLFRSRSAHIPYRDFEAANPEKFRDYFKFAFVRNPWDRLVSGYFYLRNGGAPVHQKWVEQNIAPYADFADFVRSWLTRENVRSEQRFRPQLFRPQHYFICDENLRRRVDFIGRFETIDADFCTICARLNITAKLEHLNASDHGHYSEYYTDELRERVIAAYAEDIAIFGYRFDAADRC
jgi:hypothetical protein